MQIAIGDIHGCYRELQILLDQIGPGRDDQIIALGDMIDCGPESAEVVNFFCETPNADSVLGNHERKHYMVAKGLLSSHCFGPKQEVAKAQFKRLDKKYDYGHYKKAIEFFGQLDLYKDLPSALLVHAGFEYRKPFDQQDERVVTGADYIKMNKINPQTGLPFWCDSYPRDAKPIIFGHMNLQGNKPGFPKRDNLWPIDTSCVAGWYLTAVTLPDFKIYQIKRHGSLF